MFFYARIFPRTQNCWNWGVNQPGLGRNEPFFCLVPTPTRIPCPPVHETTQGTEPREPSRSPLQNSHPPVECLHALVLFMFIVLQEQHIFILTFGSLCHCGSKLSHISQTQLDKSESQLHTFEWICLSGCLEQAVQNYSQSVCPKCHTPKRKPMTPGQPFLHSGSFTLRRDTTKYNFNVFFHLSTHFRPIPSLTSSIRDHMSHNKQATSSTKSVLLLVVRQTVFESANHEKDFLALELGRSNSRHDHLTNAWWESQSHSLQLSRITGERQHRSLSRWWITEASRDLSLSHYVLFHISASKKICATKNNEIHRTEQKIGFGKEAELTKMQCGVSETQNRPGIVENLNVLIDIPHK